MTAIADIIAASHRDEEGQCVFGIPDGWMQGRTAYGGLSAALALHAAQVSHVSLPPLRSAMTSFVGPLEGDVTVRTRELRRGRNAVFVQAEAYGEAGLGLSIVFVFMAPLQSRIDHRDMPAPDYPVPQSGDTTFRWPAPSFISNFELVDDRRASVGAAEWRRWIRLDAREGLDPMVHLIAIADALPPAAMKLLGGPAPISSMTWQCNLLTDRPETRDGWWLLTARAEQAVNGCSSQSMAIWNADGEPVASGMQSVALFA